MRTSKSILLVEDDLDDQEFFALALQGMENVSLYNIANNGREALAMLEHATILPDIIFSDINMPKMNGLEYLSALRGNPGMRDIPVVMLSTDIFTMKIAMNLGAIACIKKPTTEKILHDQIIQMMNLGFQVADRTTL